MIGSWSNRIIDESRCHMRDRHTLDESYQDVNYVALGLEVSVSSPVAVPDAVVILGLGLGLLRLAAPCRVVYTVDEPRRRGFAYGTLAGHPESGEEAFMIGHHDDGTVSFTITAFSRPSTLPARIAGPFGRIVQRRITARYLSSLP